MLKRCSLVLPFTGNWVSIIHNLTLFLRQGDHCALEHSFENIYSNPPNTGPSGIRKVIFQTLFASGYQTVRFSDIQSYNIVRTLV
jgi:hypothetical protein